MTTSTSTHRMPDDTVNAVTDSRWTNLRARMVLDLDAERPYDEGGQPVMALRYDGVRSGWRAEMADLNDGTRAWTEYQAGLDAAERCGTDFNKLERYLRIFHGCTGIDYMSDRDGTIYIACDPAGWRAVHGVPAEEQADLGEWRDYLNGEVYVILVEKLVEWNEVGGDRVMQTWDVQDSLSGLFGWSYALTTCGEMLREAGAGLDADAVMVTVTA